MKNVVADLGSKRYVPLCLLELSGLGSLLLHFELVEPGLQDSHCDFAVLVLGSLVLASDDDSCWKMSDAHRGISDIYMLAPGARGSVGVDPEILVLHFYLYVFIDFGVDKDGCKAGFAAGAGIEGTKTNQSMDPRLRGQQAVRVVAGNRKGC